MRKYFCEGSGAWQQTWSKTVHRLEVDRSPTERPHRQAIAPSLLLHQSNVDRVRKPI